MRTRFDLPDTMVGPDGRGEKPYPSWNEVMSRLHRERPGQRLQPAPEPQDREWHTLVADMIARR